LINANQVIYGFFIILTVTANYGFVLGGLDNPEHHSFSGLLFTIVANIIAIRYKIRDRTEIGYVMIATGLVALMQLILAAAVGFISFYTMGTAMTPESTLAITSLASGALLANLVAVTVFVANTLKSH